MNILVQQYLELFDQSLQTYRDVNRKAGTSQAIGHQILHALCAPAELDEPAGIMRHCRLLFRQRFTRHTPSAALFSLSMMAIKDVWLF